MGSRFSLAGAYPPTLVDLLRRRCREQPDAAAFTFLIDGETAQAALTYGELDGRARAVAAHLQSLGLEGERVLLLSPPGLEYVAAFFGCLYAGAVAVPSYPPRGNRSPDRLQAVARDAGASAALGTPVVASIVERLSADAPGLRSLRWVFPERLPDDLAGRWREPALTGESVAFLQYTSGSTTDPRGVVLTHANLLHNSECSRRCFGQTRDGRGVIWLPPYHDMGLIGGVIQPVYLGACCYLMSPVTFFTNPYAWLQAISRYRGTASGGPNFAYDLCVRKISPGQRAALDLSCWEVAFTGAEPVSAETLDRFSEFFAPCGFRREAFYPCYGLAEATLIAAGGDRGTSPRILTVRKADLEAHRAVPGGGPDSRTLVGCGRSLADQAIRIVHPERLVECPPGTVGEVWVSGPSIARGYWNRPEESRHTFGQRLADTGAGPFLRTGDLGVVHEGTLYITGRLKELIIVRGRNLYPQDLERTAARTHPALESGAGAAFSVPVRGEERLVVVHEVNQRQLSDAAAVAGAVRAALAGEHEVEPHAVVLIRGGTLPRTSSGKVRRAACRESFLAGDLEVAGEWREGTGVPAAPSGLTREALLAAVPAQRQSLLESHFRARLARALRVSPDQIDVRQSPAALGLESLTVAELKNGIESDLGVALPVTSFFQAPTLVALAARVLAQLPEAPTPGCVTPPRLPAQVEPLSDDTVNAQLARNKALV